MKDQFIEPTNMKKILFLADNLGSGGAERQMVSVARMLKRNGYDVSVLCYSEGDFNAHLLTDEEIPIIWMIEPHALPRIFKVRKYIRTHRYDVVISFLETPNFLNNLSAIGSHKWKVITGERSSMDSTFTSRKAKIYMKFQRFADVIVCNSNNARQKWMQHVPQFATKLKTIYNMVVLGEISADYCARKDGKLHMVVAASHQYLKNAMGLVRALSLMDEEQLSRIKIDWYGSKSSSGYGSKAYDEVCDYVKGHGLGNQIEFFGPTSDLANIMNQADIVALFSKLEGLPNTICEGMTIGKPIIMTRVSDYDKLVDPSNGFLCDWDNIESIKKALVQALYLNEIQLSQMGLASKNKANQLFSVESVMQQWMSVID